MQTHRHGAMRNIISENYFSYSKDQCCTTTQQKRRRNFSTFKAHRNFEFIISRALQGPDDSRKSILQKLKNAFFSLLQHETSNQTTSYGTHMRSPRVEPINHRGWSNVWNNTKCTSHYKKLKSTVINHSIKQTNPETWLQSNRLHGGKINEIKTKCSSVSKWVEKSDHHPVEKRACRKVEPIFDCFIKCFLFVRLID